MKEYYKEGNEELREEFTEEEYFANIVRPLIKEQLTTFKNIISSVHKLSLQNLVSSHRKMLTTTLQSFLVAHLTFLVTH